MRKWLLAVAILGLGGILVATDVEARRFGGGRNIGAQRNVTAPPAQTPARPAQQQQAAPAQQGTQQAAPASTGSRWLPILGGLALGGMLGYLFGGSGLLGILLLALLAIAAVVAVRAAKLNFLRLQAANDAGRLEDIREFTTDELYEELKKDLGEKQQTDVIALEADLLEVVTEGDRHWASVRFTGTVREAPGVAPEAFAEVWNLVKPADGSSGWLLAGIQQMH